MSIDSPELTPIQMCQLELTTTPTVVYPVPSGKAAFVQKLVLANTTFNFIDVYVSLVPFGDVGDSSHRIMHDVPISPEGSVSFDMMQVCSGAIAAYAEAAGLILTISGSLFDVDATIWDAAGVTWDSAGVTWDGWYGMAPWDNQVAGMTWDSLASGKTWDNYA
jgi:hypothetical protein